MVKRWLAAAGVVLALSGCASRPAPAAPTQIQTVPTEQTFGTVPDFTGETHLPTQPPQPVAETDFVRVLDYVPLMKQQLPYATQDNFTGTVIYDFTDAYLRYGTVKKLMAVGAELQSYGYGLLIWDGFRPVSAQQKLYDACPDPTYVSPPGVGKQNHCRGLAVDLTLYDLMSGQLLEMPTGFDDFSAFADRDYSDVSANAAFHALLLETTMERHGFQGYQGEWWHFNDTDEYPIETEFDPASR